MTVTLGKGDRQKIYYLKDIHLERPLASKVSTAVATALAIVLVLGAAFVAYSVGPGVGAIFGAGIGIGSLSVATLALIVVKAIRNAKLTSTNFQKLTTQEDYFAELRRRIGQTFTYRISNYSQKYAAENKGVDLEKQLNRDKNCILYQKDGKSINPETIKTNFGKLSNYASQSPFGDMSILLMAYYENRDVDAIFRQSGVKKGVINLVEGRLHFSKTYELWCEQGSTFIQATMVFDPKTDKAVISWSFSETNPDSA